MTMHHLLLAAILAANPPAASAAVPPPDQAKDEVPPPSPQARAYFDGLIDSMRRSPSARERALSALMFAWGPIEDPDRKAHAEILRLAAQSAPADPVVQFAWSMATPSKAECRSEAACREQRLAAARAEPDNGMAWLIALRSDLPPAEVDEILERAANADRFDDHYVDAIEVWAHAFDAQPMPVAVARLAFAQSGEPAWERESDPRLAGRMHAIGQSVTFLLFGQGAYFACNRKRQPDLPQARFETCARLGRKIMQTGTTDMMLGTGASVVKTTGLATPEDLERVLRYRWLRDQLGNSPGLMASVREFNLYFDDLMSTRSEVRAQELMLSRQGFTLDPPAGWKPANE